MSFFKPLTNVIVCNIEMLLIKCKTLNMSLNVGDIAPDFTLFSTDKKEISLSDYKDKNVLVLFFPLAFTSVCTDELCETRDNKKMYDDLSTDVLAISGDSLFTLDEFKKQQKFNFELLSDFNKEAATNYGSLYEEFAFGMRGVSKRSAFVIGKDGKIKYAEVLDNAGEIPNFTAIVEVLNAL